MTFSYLLQLVFAGIAAGSIYAMVALGFNVIYNTTGIINFAQGEFVVIGGMMTVTLTQTAGVPVWLAVPVAVLITAAAGALVELVFIEPARSPSVLRMIVITIGVSIILREAVLHIWDEKMRAMPPFSGDETTSYEFLGAFFRPQSLWIIGAMVISVVVLEGFFRLTITGRAMRACADNRQAASLVGIAPKRMVLLSFVVAAGLGGLAGTVVTPDTQISYNAGAELAIWGFLAMVVGGLGSAGGAVVGGLLIGILVKVCDGVLPPDYRTGLVFGLLICLLCVRPSGLMGSRVRTLLREF